MKYQHQEMKATGLISLIALLLLAAPIQAAPQPITVVFRFDDYSTTSNTAFEMSLFQMFADRKMPVTVGIVPGPVDGSRPVGRMAQPMLTLDKAQAIRPWIERGAVEPALHGYSHVIATDAPLPRSEFIGMPGHQQAEQIAAGRQFLESILSTTVQTFVPPFNGYDLNTLEACQGAGIATFSASLWGPKPTSDCELRFLPSTCSPSTLRDAVTEARRSESQQQVIVALLHESDFQEARPAGTWTLTAMAQLLDWIAQQPDVQVLTVAQVATQQPGYTARRFAQWVDLRQAPLSGWQRRVMPDRLCDLLAVQFQHIPTEAELLLEWRRIDRIVVAFWLGVLAIWMTASMIVSHMTHRAWHLLALTCAALLVLWATWLRHEWPAFKLLFITMAWAGVGAGMRARHLMGWMAVRCRAAAGTLLASLGMTGPVVRAER